MPDAFLGDVLGDVSARRGHIMGTDTDGTATTVRAVVPQSELHLYATTLHSLTHGFGMFVKRFHGYEQVPAEAAHKVIAEHAKDREELMA